MPIKSRPNSFIAPSIKDRSQQNSSFSNFTQWIKGVILRKPKSKSKSNPDIFTNERSIKRSSSTRRTPSKKSFTSNKRRRSRRVNRRSGTGGSISRGSRSESGPHSNSNNFNPNNSNHNLPNSNSNSNSDSDSDSDLCENNKNENFIVINDDDLKNNDCDDNNNNNNNSNMIIPNVNSDTREFSTSVDQQQPRSSTSSTSSTTSSSYTSSSDDDDDDDDSRKDYFENTRIIKGSDEHFAYVRTLRKLRKDRQRPMNQAVLLNNILEAISIPSLLSDEIRKELSHFKSRVYELNRLKRNSIFNINDTNGSSLFNNSTLSLCPSSLMNKRLSAIIAEVQPVKSPITMKYRPSYASSKVVTIFDEITNQLVVKELPLARRKRRLSDLSNILVRSTSSSSTTSTNSSQSSLVTLTDDVEQYSTLTKEPKSYITNHIIIRKDDDYEEGCYEDDVPLFVLKEQFRYSGRGYGLMKNNLPSLEVNGPPCVTLTV